MCVCACVCLCVCAELMHTERTHVRDLRVMQLLFYQPMASDTWPSRDFTKILFPSLDTVIKMHGYTFRLRLFAIFYHDEFLLFRIISCHSYNFSDRFEHFLPHVGQTAELILEKYVQVTFFAINVELLGLTLNIEVLFR